MSKKKKKTGPKKRFDETLAPIGVKSGIKDKLEELAGDNKTINDVRRDAYEHYIDSGL